MTDSFEIILKAFYRFMEYFILVGGSTLIGNIFNINLKLGFREVVMMSLLLLGVRFIFLIIVAIQLLLTTPKSPLFQIIPENIKSEIKTELIKKQLKDLI